PRFSVQLMIFPKQTKWRKVRVPNEKHYELAASVANRNFQSQFSSIRDILPNGHFCRTNGQALGSHCCVGARGNGA
ncbi:Hypothetical predicted protein, partial [Paramuricea clavata]